MGLSLADATRLVESRNKTATFKDIADFSTRLPGMNFQVSNSEAMTNFFLVNGKVRMNRVESEVQALIERNGPTTTLVWIREY